MITAGRLSLEDWLFTLENRYQQEIQLGLTRVKQVAERLNLLQPTATVVTVGGTNGKGSTVALLEAIYRRAGYSVGVYTSPHLVSFNERIKINQQHISDEQLVMAFEAVEEARGLIHLTYFEMATLAALWHFKKHQLDLIILEVGLGGRLDATNIINPDLAIITTVDKDHEEYLGNTIEDIGYEKAGILRANKPFIYADQNPPKRVLEEASRLGVVCYRQGEEYTLELAGDLVHFSFGKQSIALPATSFHRNSLGAAIMASFCLGDELPLSDIQRIEGINHTFLTGRLQVVDLPRRTLLDVAHNPQAAQYLAAFLTANYPNTKIHAVFSAFADKDINGLITPLAAIVDCWYPALLQGKRAASATQLITALKRREINQTLCYNDAILAYKAACEEASPDDLIVVYGSFFMVGPVLSTLPIP
ncbi:MAG: bifunctional tetrahydrofolate synthase/dihydrofolate synthase [Legionella sp.]|nr:bifunctional tetrahydrofolate synthase/dihydrofolate synthase [Legionella sp.]